MTQCSDTSQALYFWNISNPQEVRSPEVEAGRSCSHHPPLASHADPLNGAPHAIQVLQGAPPALQQVGPYVFDVTTVNFNVQYLPADPLGPDRVQWATLPFADFVPSKSCATCGNLNATVRGPVRSTAAQALTLRRASVRPGLWAKLAVRQDHGDSGLERRRVAAAVRAGARRCAARQAHCATSDSPPCPRDGVQATLTQLLAQMAQAVTQFVSQQPGLTALFPRLSTVSPQVLALEQWANCGALNGMTVQSLGIASLAALMPTPPEFCGWAQSYMGASKADASLPTATAAQVVAILNSSAHGCSFWDATLRKQMS